MNEPLLHAYATVGDLSTYVTGTAVEVAGGRSR
jgi:hypothetical protein